jgi:hypothetical protein
LLDTGHSLLCEWTTPNNRIVIDYGKEPELTLVGCVNHADYSLLTQTHLDRLCESGIIDAPRPKRYQFKTVTEMVSIVKGFENEEGIVLYYNNDQSMKKVKGEQYLSLHRFKFNATFDKVLDMFFEYVEQKPIECSFHPYLQSKFDYECYTMISEYASSVQRSYMKSCELIKKLKKEVEKISRLSRKDAAEIILNKHSNDGLSGLCFTLLSGKDISVGEMRKLMTKIMETDRDKQMEKIK